MSHQDITFTEIEKELEERLQAFADAEKTLSFAKNARLDALTRLRQIQNIFDEKVRITKLSASQAESQWNLSEDDLFENGK